MLRGSPLAHPADGEAEEVEALLDVGHAGFLLGQPQPQRGQHSGHFGAQRLGVVAAAVDHDDEVVGVPDQPPGAQALFPALSPLPAGSHLLPAPGEMVIQR
jgi:hypothetical protein